MLSTVIAETRLSWFILYWFQIHLLTRFFNTQNLRQVKCTQLLELHRIFLKFHFLFYFCKIWIQPLISISWYSWKSTLSWLIFLKTYKNTVLKITIHMFYIYSMSFDVAFLHFIKVILSMHFIKIIKSCAKTFAHLNFAFSKTPLTPPNFILHWCGVTYLNGYV